ncbi:hypothetical protein EVAR_92893_1 [Eumeta japonica]|uniref:Uncharacterized protein n=1 Tax=Eumeta variegata TaxID=151549 RepID=A0A4C1TDA1_EUMVA|nr:hypothetical protein EVAR_92893_1 [Eumeta japonica]
MYKNMVRMAAAERLRTGIRTRMYRVRPRPLRCVTQRPHNPLAPVVDVQLETTLVSNPDPQWVEGRKYTPAI